MQYRTVEGWNFFEKLQKNDSDLMANFTNSMNSCWIKVSQKSDGKREYWLQDKLYWLQTVLYFGQFKAWELAGKSDMTKITAIHWVHQAFQLFEICRACFLYSFVEWN